MDRLLMLDSGAFSVWSQGASIDLEAYIQFCLRYPDISYYVNLDVIPGVPNVKRSLTPEAVEASCQQGWDNYIRMLDAGVPYQQVIPVYHQNDGIHWLEKYLEFGTPYLGISPANDMTTTQKLQWMAGLRKHLFDSSGKPIVLTHGFAVTSYDLMRFWNWHSVDSASWKLTAAWGAVYVPQTKSGVNDFSQPPLHIVTSPNTLAKQKFQSHLNACSPGVKARILDWLAECGVKEGAFTEAKEKPGYKLNRETGEFWINKGKGILARVTEKGVRTSFEERAKVNVEFVKRMEKVLPVDNIYFAGAPMPYDVEWDCAKRLFSYHELGKGKTENKYLRGHLDWIAADAKGGG